jgi:predicted house-cleaning noncanonical NTP pyrophosphatase (MazG superfamily)
MQMETLIIQWVQTHIDVIRYGAILFGFFYSYHRRFVLDRREDYRELLKNKYIARISEDLAETKRLRELADAAVIAHVAEKNALLADNITYQQTIIELHKIIENFMQHLVVNQPSVIDGGKKDERVLDISNDFRF